MPEEVKAQAEAGQAKEEKVIKVQVDAEEMTIGDLEFLLEWQSNQKRQPTSEDLLALFGFLNRIVIGGVKQYKLKELPDLMSALQGQVTQIANPVTALGN